MQALLLPAVLFSLIAIAARAWSGAGTLFTRAQWPTLRVPSLRARREAPSERLARIEAILTGLGDAQVLAAFSRYASAHRRLAAAAALSPVIPTQVRRCLGPATRGTLDATRLLARLWRSPRHTRARDEYLAFLADLRAACAAAARSLEQAAHERMTLEMDVVREHLNPPGPHQPKG